MTDLVVLRDRLRVALPQLTFALAELEHSETRDCHLALLIETAERKKDHVYRMTVSIIDDRVHFFVHVHGTSKDLTTQGTDRFSKEYSRRPVRDRAWLLDWSEAVMTKAARRFRVIDLGGMTCP